ncbi:hypothetical protein J7K27_05130 [Candidatus Bathyarchaeota archaeon]|nr:hypothetical protein [Candidatus Bathyarchaeota archaeon]
MSGTFQLKNRDELKRRILEVFRDQISVLSDDFREIFADDMVTAFQNRLLVLAKIQSKELTEKKD